MSPRGSPSACPSPLLLPPPPSHGTLLTVECLPFVYVAVVQEQRAEAGTRAFMQQQPFLGYGEDAAASPPPPLAMPTFSAGAPGGGSGGLRLSPYSGGALALVGTMTKLSPEAATVS